MRNYSRYAPLFTYVLRGIPFLTDGAAWPLCSPRSRTVTSPAHRVTCFYPSPGPEACEGPFSITPSRVDTPGFLSADFPRCAGPEPSRRRMPATAARGSLRRLSSRLASSPRVGVPRPGAPAAAPPGGFVASTCFAGTGSFWPEVGARHPEKRGARWKETALVGV